MRAFFVLLFLFLLFAMTGTMGHTDTQQSANRQNVEKVSPDQMEKDFEEYLQKYNRQKFSEISSQGEDEWNEIRKLDQN